MSGPKRADRAEIAEIADRPDIAARMEDVVASARVVVCVGPGGVGKTSVAAAVGLFAAREGRRSLVLTIDPARRLANALGLPEIGQGERDVPSQAFVSAGLPIPAGRMTAMMLDIKTAWDEVVARHHPDPEKRRRLMDNRLYVALSTALAGSQEYMAMEKLYELSTRTVDPLDLIVLDTPPSEHVMDFLEAPSRMLDALDNEATRWLVEPFHASGRISRKVFDAGSSFFIRTISRFTGTELLRDLAELLSGFQDMFEGFRARAQSVRALLAAPDTLFLIIGTPRPAALSSVQSFYERLRERKVRVGAVVLNRAAVDVFGEGSPVGPLELESWVREAGGSRSLSRRLEQATAECDRAYRHEGAEIEALLPRLGETVVAKIEELPQDVHDLASLDALARALFSSPHA